MNVLNEFIASYGATILYSILTAIIGYVGIAIKSLYEKYVNDSTKKAVAKTCVSAVEQIYKDLHGDEKLQMCASAMTEMLAEKGIVVSDLEVRMLIEAAVKEMNITIKNIINEEEKDNEYCD